MKATFILGVLALALSACGASAAPMQFTQFTQGDNAYIIVAEGEITENTPSEFGRLITSPGTAIYFDSPGGSLGAALSLGRMIRHAGLNTYVAPSGKGCYSACVYAFASGVVRTYDGVASLGVHQFSGGTNNQSAAQTVVAIVGSYLDEMGIDHRLLEAASVVAPERIEIVPVETAREWGLDNSRPGVTRPTASVGLAAADRFHLRSECNVLGERIFQDQVNSALSPPTDSPDESAAARRSNESTRRWLQTAEAQATIRAGYSWSSRYDAETGSCYAQINLTSPGIQAESLYDVQSRNILATAGISDLTIWGKRQHSEDGVIAGVPGEENNTHAGYLRAKAFIDSHMHEGN